MFFFLFLLDTLLLGFGRIFHVSSDCFNFGFAIVRSYGSRSVTYSFRLGFLDHTESNRRLSLFRVHGRLQKQDQVEERRQDVSWPSEPFQTWGVGYHRTSNHQDAKKRALRLILHYAFYIYTRSYTVRFQIWKELKHHQKKLKSI